MNGRLVATLAVGLVLGLALASPGWQQAQGQRQEKAHGLRWEYKVVSFSQQADEATKHLNKLADDGWEYVGLVSTAVPPASVAAGRATIPGHDSLVAFKRPRK